MPVNDPTSIQAPLTRRRFLEQRASRGGQGGERRMPADTAADTGQLDFGEDTDNDGVLDHPNVWPEGGDPRALPGRVVRAPALHRAVGYHRVVQGVA